jgi:hypothetical protein
VRNVLTVIAVPLPGSSSPFVVRSAASSPSLPSPTPFGGPRPAIGTLGSGQEDKTTGLKSQYVKIPEKPKIVCKAARACLCESLTTIADEILPERKVTYELLPPTDTALKAPAVPARAASKLCARCNLAKPESKVTIATVPLKLCGPCVQVRAQCRADGPCA